MTEEDRKNVAQERRKCIMSALKDVDDLKFLWRIYISILVARENTYNAHPPEEPKVKEKMPGHRRTTSKHTKG